MHTITDRLLGYRELRNYVPYSRVHIYRLELDGKFPRRVQIGPARVGWSWLEVQDWIEARKSERFDPPEIV